MTDVAAGPWRANLIRLAAQSIELLVLDEWIRKGIFLDASGWKEREASDIPFAKLREGKFQ